MLHNNVLDFKDALYVQMLQAAMNVTLDRYYIVSLIDANRVPVSFHQIAYNVLEAEKQVAITLDAHADHDFSFYVYVTTREGTATCECHAVIHAQT